MHKSEHPIIRPLPPLQLTGDFLAEPAGLCLANCLFELRGYSRALIQFQRLVEKNPQSLRGNLQNGLIYTCSDADDLFDLDVAEQTLQRALAISPEESGCFLQLGMVICAKVDLERASKYFSMARQLNFKAVEATISMAAFSGNRLTREYGDNAASPGNQIQPRPKAST